jgi:hypothetical protein
VRDALEAQPFALDPDADEANRELTQRRGLFVELVRRQTT